MKQILFVLACLANLAALTMPLDLALMQSKIIDPSQMYNIDCQYPDCTSLLIGATKEGQTAWTAMVWVKSDESYHTRATVARPIPMMNFSTRQGISNAEGGTQVLTDLLPFGSDTPVPLDSEGHYVGLNVLPETYDDGGYESDDWQFGCYCVNLRTDTPLTLIVGGTEKQITEVGEKLIFNIKCETADRSVIVMSEDPSATVYLEIAENPLVEFYGDMISTMDDCGVGIDFDDVFSGFTGIRDDEYTLIVAQAKVNPDKTLTYRMSAFLHDIDYWRDPVEGVATKYQLPEACFGKESRIAMHFAAMAGLIEGSYLSVYGVKLFDKWLDDSYITMIRDQDIAEMRRRGYPVPEHDVDYWAVKAGGTQYRVVETNDVPPVYYLGTNGISGTLYRNRTDYHHYITARVTNGKATTHPYVNEDIEWDIVEGDYPRGSTPNIFKVPTNGTYTVRGTDPLGESKYTSLTFNSHEHQYNYSIDLETMPSTPYIDLANDTVIEALRHATTDGVLHNYNPWGTPSQYRLWYVKRLYTRPMISSAGATGNRAMCLLSPHVFSSATHWGSYVQGTLTFVSEDNTITSVVKTAKKLVKLSDWALSHGFSKEEVADADCGDLSVGRFAEGTVDPSLCPYFLNPSIASNYFGNTRSQILGWTTSQLKVGWGFPCLLSPNDNRFTSWQCAPMIDSLTNRCSVGSNYDGIFTGIDAIIQHLDPDRVDIINEMKASLPYDDGYRMQDMFGGDSGLPTYIDLGGKLIIYTTTLGRGIGWIGPSYVKSWKLLKAYIEDAGDEFKLIDLPLLEDK